MKVRVGDGVRTRMFPILLLVLPLFLEQMGALAAAS